MIGKCPACESPKIVVKGKVLPEDKKHIFKNIICSNCGNKFHSKSKFGKPNHEWVKYNKGWKK